MAPPYTLEPNSTTEHYHRHIVEIGMTMLHLAKLPLQFCLHAFLTAAYLINRIPTPVLNNDSPFVCLHGHVPNYSKLQVFGCLCYPWFQPYNTNKLQPRLSPCVFLGYSSNQSPYKCFDMSSSRLYLSQHVDFVKNSFQLESKRPQGSILNTWSSLHFVLPFDQTPIGTCVVTQTSSSGTLLSPAVPSLPMSSPGRFEEPNSAISSTNSDSPNVSEQSVSCENQAG